MNLIYIRDLRLEERQVSGECSRAQNQSPAQPNTHAAVDFTQSIQETVGSEPHMNECVTECNFDYLPPYEHAEFYVTISEGPCVTKPPPYFVATLYM